MTTLLAGKTYGPYDTLLQMKQLVVDSLRDPLVIESARQIVREAAPHDYDGQALAIRYYLTEHLQFVRDPRGQETLAEPHYLLSQIARSYYVQGDCDDAAILGCALAKAVGFRCRFIVQGFNTPNAPFSHVFGAVLGRTRWFDLDTTRPSMSTAVVTRQSSIEV